MDREDILNRVFESNDPEVDLFFKKVAADTGAGFDMLYDANLGKYSDAINKAVSDMYNEVAMDSGLHPDDDFEDIYDRMLDQIEADYGPKEDYKQTFEGDDKYDHEADMARSQLMRTAEKAIALFKMIKSGDNLEGWTAAKITKAADYLDSVHNYMSYEMLKAQEQDRIKTISNSKDSYHEGLEHKLNEEKKGLYTAKEGVETKCADCGKPSYKTLPEEKQKGVDGKVCWKGYKRMGTKKKGGKTVDNCVKM